MIRSFLSDLLWAWRGIPSEIIRLWRESHRVTPWLRYWRDPSVRVIRIDALRLGEQSYYDHRLWLMLGVLSDMVLALLMISVVALVLLAVI